MSAGALRELLVAFGIDVEGEEKLDHVDKKLDGLFGKFKHIGEVAAEAFALHELKEFIEGQIEAGAQLKVTADRLGTSTDELQALELAAGEAGASAGALTTGLRFLNRNLAEASEKGGEQAQLFRSMGISIKDAAGVTRPAGDVLGDLADHIAEMQDPAKKTAIAMKLLGRGGAELIPLLNRGSEAFEEARKSMQELGGGMSSEFVDQAHEGEAANVRLNFALTGLKSLIAGLLLPAVVKIVEWMTKIVAVAVDVSKHTTILKTGLEALAVVSGVKLAFSLSKLARTLGFLKPSILETVVAFGGFLLPMLGIAAAYLLFNDFWTMMKGGKSIIGDDLDALFGLGTAQSVAKGLNDSFSEVATTLRVSVGGAIQEVWDWLKSLGQAMSDFEGGNFGKILEDLGGTGETSELGMENMLGENGDGGSTNAPPAGPAPEARSLLGIDAPSALGERRMFEGGEGASEDVPDDAPPAAAPRVREPQDFAFLHGAPKAHSQSVHVPTSPRFDAPSAAVTAAADQAAAGPTIQQSNKTEVTVYTSSDKPQAVGEAVGQGVATSQQKANNNALSGVRRP